MLEATRVGEDALVLVEGLGVLVLGVLVLGVLVLDVLVLDVLVLDVLVLDVSLLDVLVLDVLLLLPPLLDSLEMLLEVPLPLLLGPPAPPPHMLCCRPSAVARSSELQVLDMQGPTACWNAIVQKHGSLLCRRSSVHRLAIRTLDKQGGTHKEVQGPS